MENGNFITDKIIDSMKSIFAFSRSRVSDADKAEDLSQQIITELLASAETLKDEKAFYGWMWAVAKNTYSKYIRAGKKESFYTNGIDIYICDSNTNIENDIVMKEDINFLRRELSLLASQYREAVIKYYIEEKSCSQISKELSVSVETVKHLLFKARKILKEGINMERKYGEKSYNPDIFRATMWVSDGAWEKYNHWHQVFETRRLPGNILLSTYYSPMTVEELSVELGVSAPYIEDEINAMLKSGHIKLLPKARYQANLFIYTDSCDAEISAKTKNLYSEYGKQLINHVDKMIPMFRENMSGGTDMPQNNLRWFVSHFILWHTLSEKMPGDPMPLLPLGGRGYLWGYNYEYKQSGFSGIYGKCTSEHYNGWIHAANYKLLEKNQVRIGGSNEEIDFILAAANKSYERFSADKIARFIQWQFIEKDGDSYKSLCPSMTEAQYKRLCELCSEAKEEIKQIFTNLIDVTAAVMENHAPAAIKDQCKPLASIKADGIAEIIEYLCESDYLMIPTSHSFLTIFAVV